MTSFTRATEPFLEALDLERVTSGFSKPTGTPCAVRVSGDYVGIIPRPSLVVFVPLTTSEDETSREVGEWIQIGAAKTLEYNTAPVERRLLTDFGSLLSWASKRGRADDAMSIVSVDGVVYHIPIRQPDPRRICGAVFNRSLVREALQPLVVLGTAGSVPVELGLIRCHGQLGGREIPAHQLRIRCGDVSAFIMCCLENEAFAFLDDALDGAPGVHAEDVER